MIYTIACSTCGAIFNLEEKEREKEKLQREMEASGFWEDHSHAQQVMRQHRALCSWTESYAQIRESTTWIHSLLPELKSHPDQDLLEELQEESKRLLIQIEELEMRKMLSGELDHHNCFLSIQAGAGGTESCDWAAMLLRMYERWVEKRGWKWEVLDCLQGDVAGIKSVQCRISGQYAYGYAKAEKGVHRLVRISPFDSNAKRHTSFASVESTPELEEDFEIEIRPEDLRIDTFRSSGAGGQHVNTTDSAVRITHEPTGLSFASGKERSQHQNREFCMRLLRAKLYEQKVEEREKKLRELQGEKKAIGWGNQVRNYVLHPYSLITDLRTGLKCGNVQAVLDGDLDPFIHAYLKECT